MTLSQSGTQKVLISADLEAKIQASIKESSNSLMLFGSYARGDYGKESDIDILQATHSRMRPYRKGRVSVSPYTLRTLSYLASHGSLFVLHLLTDGIIVRDVADRLGQTLRLYQPPENYDYYRSELRGSVALLDCSRHQYEEQWSTFHRIAIFLLRSVCFSICAERGVPTFAVKDVAHRLKDPRILTAYSLKSQESPSFTTFRSCTRLIAEYLGGEARNPYGSLEALLIHATVPNKLLKGLGSKLLEEDDSGDDYAKFAQHTEDLVCPLP